MDAPEFPNGEDTKSDNEDTTPDNNSTELPDNDSTELPDSKRTKQGRRSWQVLSSLAVAVLLTLISQFITLPYYILSPGNALAVQSLIEVPADKAHPPKGQILLTTVAEQRAHPLDMVWAWIEPNRQILSTKEVQGPQTSTQYNQDNSLAIDESKLTAIYVAFHRLGLQADLVDDAEVKDVTANGPSIGKLNVGDLITAVNGVAVRSADDVGSKVRPVPVGNTVHFDVTGPDGKHRTVDLVTAKRPVLPGDDPTQVPTQGPSSYVGISVQSKNPRLDTQFPAQINTSNIGGPSAGLAFSLAMIDDLSPGNLTGGRKVAVTGTIDLDGNVGPVGGVVQKTAAVRASGATLFLVPTDEYADAKKHAGSKLKVVAVDTLDQALDALRANGGDVSGVPAVSATTTTTSTTAP